MTEASRYGSPCWSARVTGHLGGGVCFGTLGKSGGWSAGTAGRGRRQPEKFKQRPPPLCQGSRHLREEGQNIVFAEPHAK